MTTPYRYRIQNLQGQVLSHVDTGAQAANVITGLGDLAANYYSEDLLAGTAYPFTTWKRELVGWVGTPHKQRPHLPRTHGYCPICEHWGSDCTANNN
jgi:hypothetical protein